MEIQPSASTGRGRLRSDVGCGRDRGVSFADAPRGQRSIPGDHHGWRQWTNGSDRGKDIQVDWQTDGPLFEALAQAHPNLHIAYAPDANHVLKHEPRERETLTAADAAGGYNAEGTQLDRKPVEIILGLLKKLHNFYE